jgi:hypothetical protein
LLLLAANLHPGQSRWPNERVEMREQMDAKGLGSRALINDALQRRNANHDRRGDRGQLIDTEVAPLDRRLGYGDRGKNKPLLP